MRDVVIVPDVEEHGRCGGAPCHHEGGEVGGVELRFDVNADVDDEANEGEEEAGSDEGEAQPCEVAGEGEDEQHDCAGDVGGYGIKVCFYGAVA